MAKYPQSPKNPDKSDVPLTGFTGKLNDATQALGGFTSGLSGFGAGPLAMFGNSIGGFGQALNQQVKRVSQQYAEGQLEGQKKLLSMMTVRQLAFVGQQQKAGATLGQAITAAGGKLPGFGESIGGLTKLAGPAGIVLGGLATAAGVAVGALNAMGGNRTSGVTVFQQALTVLGATAGMVLAPAFLGLSASMIRLGAAITPVVTGLTQFAGWLVRNTPSLRTTGQLAAGGLASLLPTGLGAIVRGAAGGVGMPVGRPGLVAGGAGVAAAKAPGRPAGGGAGEAPSRPPDSFASELRRALNVFKTQNLPKAQYSSAADYGKAVQQAALQSPYEAMIQAQVQKMVTLMERQVELAEQSAAEARGGSALGP